MGLGAMKRNLQTRHHFDVHVENYLKALWNIAQKKGADGIRNAELAAYLGVTRPSVTNMSAKLIRKGLVKKNAEKNLELTVRGRREVYFILRKHRLVELFLEKVLSLDHMTLHEEAELLEHAVSPRLLAAIEESLGFPELDPQGMPIPKADTKTFADRSKSMRSLSDCKNDERVAIVSVADYEPAVLKTLFELGFQNGLRGRVHRLENTIRFEVDGKLLGPLTSEQARFVQIRKA
jgi:DtxR family Mn-dependent transcriptional regulator